MSEATRKMRIFIDRLGPSLDAGNTAPLELLFWEIVEWIENEEKKSTDASKPISHPTDS
jgi:hypothetical protein